jgi:hypothetical protein
MLRLIRQLVRAYRGMLFFTLDRHDGGDCREPGSALAAQDISPQHKIARLADSPSWLRKNSPTQRVLRFREFTRSRDRELTYLADRK